MSGIFVDENERIEITINYKLSPENKIEILEAPEKDSQSLTVKFAVPDYQLNQRILQGSMKQTADGGMTMDFFAMQQSLLMGLAREWDAKDGKGEDVPVTPTNIGNLRVDLAKTLAAKLLEKTGSVF